MITLSRKSWTAYLPVLALGFVLLLLLVPIAWHWSIGYGAASFVVIGLFVGYRISLLRSIHLYYDDIGVWVYSGIFPWDKGVQGVKWRDLDEASYIKGMSAWLLKSYSIRIGHRFTKSSEVLLSHMSRGNEAVVTVNSLHQNLVRQNALQ